VEGARYSWREYLLYAGPSKGYIWLMEEDGAWQYVTPLGPGSVAEQGGSCQLEGRSYSFKQSVTADVEYVIGEFYWKVEIGEAVRATEYQGHGHIVSVEQAPTEVSTSLCERIGDKELEQAFGIKLAGLPGASGSGCGKGATTILIIAIVFIVLALICVSAASGGCRGGSYSGSSGGFGGPSPGGGGK
jgi:hypothetical protein